MKRLFKRKNFWVALGALAAVAALLWRRSADATPAVSASIIPAGAGGGGGGAPSGGNSLAQTVAGLLTQSPGGGTPTPPAGQQTPPAGGTPTPPAGTQTPQTTRRPAAIVDRGNAPRTPEFAARATAASAAAAQARQERTAQRTAQSQAFKEHLATTGRGTIRVQDGKPDRGRGRR